MEVKDLDRELSFKIGDPVEDNGEGEIFSAEDRVDYIERAYSKLRRFVRVLMRDYQPHFTNVKSLIEYEHSNQPVVVDPPSLTD